MSARAKTVLVVEDEAPIRIVVAEALIDAGFAIKEAAHADEALAMPDASADEIDLLFTDVPHSQGLGIGGFDGGRTYGGGICYVRWTRANQTMSPTRERSRRTREKRAVA